MNVQIQKSENLKSAVTPYLSVDRVSMAYADLKILNDLSLQLYKGEIGCLLGSSGCGKTTLLRSIAGFETPQQGSISLNDHTLIGTVKVALSATMASCISNSVGARSGAASWRML